MSSLEKALEPQTTLARSKSRDKGKQRLVADPSVGSRDMANVIRKFTVYKESTDLYALLAPPKALKLNWKQPCDPEWMLKMSSLCFDFAELAPNSKLKGSKLREAISLLLEKGDVTNSTNKDKRSFVDSCDLMIRIAMQQFRHAKSDLGKRDQLFKRLPKAHSARIKLVLDSILLPRDFQESSDEEGDVSFWQPEKNEADPENSKDPKALVLAVPDVLAVLADPASSSKPDPTEYDTEAFQQMFNEAVPRTPTGPSKAKVGFSPGDAYAQSPSFQVGSATFKITPTSLPDKDVGLPDKPPNKPPLKRPSSAEIPTETQAKAQAKSSEVNDESLLSEAMGFAPAPKKKAKIMKKPSASASPRAPTMKRPASAGPSQPVED